MAYKLYGGVARTEAEYRALKSRWIARVYDDLDDALGYAMKMSDLDLEIPWEIEGDDGKSIGRPEIAEIVRRRRHELRDRPKKY